MRLNVRFASIILAVGGIAASSSVQAATQGSLGATSEGSITINASVPSRARISGLSDVSFLNQDPATAASSAQDICVWTNTATRNYTITASGSGAANAFTLTDGSATVAYSVEWNQDAGQATGTALAAATASAALTSTATHQSCANGPSASASLIIGIDTTELSAMLAGSTYTGALTLLVTPQ